MPKGKSPGKVSLAGAGALGIKLKATISAQSQIKGTIVKISTRAQKKNLGAGAAEVAPEKRGLQQRVFIISQSKEYATSYQIA